MRWVYDFFFVLAAVLLSPVWMARLLRSGKWRTDWPGRFGYARLRPAPGEAPESLNADGQGTGRQAASGARAADSRPTMLLYAVSVGEVNAMQRLVERLAEATAGGWRIVIASTTNTGMARAQTLFGPRFDVVRYPLDFGPFVRRFLNRVRPDLVGLMELEVWPNFVAHCRRRSIPVCVLNGRLSERSFRRYRRLTPLLRPTFARLSAVAAQTPAIAERFAALGVPAERIAVLDTMKWDTAPDPGRVEGAQALAAALGIDRTRPVIVAGSTGPGEERLLIDSCPPGVQLVLVPRKPERFEEVAGLAPMVRRSARPDGTGDGGQGSEVRSQKSEVRSQKSEVRGQKSEVGRQSTPPTPVLSVSEGRDRQPEVRGQKSEVRGHQAGPEPQRRSGSAHRPDTPCVFLLDTMGELLKAYALADVAIVGRSFLGLYGSNVMEPIALGKPTIVGPHHSDFAEIVAALREAGGIVVTDEPGAAAARLLAHPEEARALAARGCEVILSRQGATQRHVEMLMRFATAR